MREELANTLSHCLGLIATIIATPILLIAAWRAHNPGFFVGTIIFAATMFILYLASMLYHAWPPTRTKQILQTLDHCAIFLLIAGTYTPFSLGPLNGTWGLSILWIVWALAIVGVLFKAIRGPVRHRRLSLSLYLVTGWFPVTLLAFFIPTFAFRNPLPPGAWFWLIAGGVAYTTGVLFYVNERARYSHFVWHLFVLTGSTCHFFALMACVA
jgi:hemolysin III